MAIRGSGAFRRFKDGIHRYDIAEQWYAYRDAAIEDIAREWLEENDIPYTTGREAPGELPEGPG